MTEREAIAALADTLARLSTWALFGDQVSPYQRDLIATEFARIATAMEQPATDDRSR
jgi:hypothetical protein